MAPYRNVYRMLTDARGAAAKLDALGALLNDQRWLKGEQYHMFAFAVRSLVPIWNEWIVDYNMRKTDFERATFPNKVN